MSVVTAAYRESRGHILLLATAANERHQRFDPELGVAAMASVPIARLLPDCPGPVDVTQVVNPGEPQSVLARVHAAAITEGPLLIYICGQIARERKHRQIHLRLAKTTEGNTRTTALPWQWIDLELAGRRPGTTRVVVDLLGHPSCGNLHPNDLQLPAHVDRWGTVARPDRRSAWTVPAYTKALTRLASAPGTETLGQLHTRALAESGPGPGTVVFGGTLPAAAPDVPATPGRQLDRLLPDPAAVSPRLPGSRASGPATVVDDYRSALAQAMRDGRRTEASRLASLWEHQIIRSHGSHSMPMGDVLEAQASIAMESGDVARAAQLWISTARNRTTWCRPSAEPLQLALRNAQASWFQLDLSWPQGRQLGADLVDVLRKAGQPGPIVAVERRLNNPQTVS
ncbi:hypothetical protein SAMN05216371_7779 [Streptomyces sp. TLI_053]|uniref:hypothetical protein n=1 Tax=Streptomyces sp. TLI_053 TaxID=1855352 RepID=UPI00087AE8E7|nr:hypothetical protein [Streptomyces sp. TLI_053]SDT82967.1 hypothetical protein SAMN05216371_7779 [Streptomyces sp. TLI_053]